ncbi:homoserine kinase [Luteimonas wenzhouensis]|uniref:Homoserine kinase n=1 Tax=Luteimonas wenzhouensis TaxID=2599615 RepID=A0A5C5TYU3_9GAMM|nr:homoserine kinase [Luteimonas wenzhouensis]NLW97330.1 homoserine kinase [Xanthomonadaceae bacterium]TWT18934.1 homoserine kinase [Luteimonas wenzhouensis]
MNHSATAFAPASVGNIGVGFDLLGHAIDGPRDLATVRRIAEPQVRIDAIGGDIAGADTLPLDPRRNTAGGALLALREALGLPYGFALELHKGVPLGSGLGGSAASCVAALVAANALLDAPLPREALYRFALDGEAISSGSRHGDNVAPMLLGGVALATEARALRIAAPDWLHAVVVHPDQVLETRRSREVLAAPYPLADVVRQGAHLAQFLLGLQHDDADLLRDGLRDVLVEPRRAPLIPGFSAVKAAALEHGALGASISGGGPSVFAWFDARAAAERAAPAMRQAFVDAGFDARAYVTPVNAPAAEVVARSSAQPAPARAATGA